MLLECACAGEDWEESAESSSRRASSLLQLHDGDAVQPLYEAAARLDGARMALDTTNGDDEDEVYARSWRCDPV
jgi:hypothetical protein